MGWFCVRYEKTRYSIDEDSRRIGGLEWTVIGMWLCMDGYSGEGDTVQYIYSLLSFAECHEISIIW